MRTSYPYIPGVKTERDTKDMDRKKLGLFQGW